jgi:hypothetical protein
LGGIVSRSDTAAVVPERGPLLPQKRTEAPAAITPDPPLLILIQHRDKAATYQIVACLEAVAIAPPITPCYNHG